MIVRFYILLGVFYVVLYKLCILLYNLCVILCFLLCLVIDLFYLGGIGFVFIELCMARITVEVRVPRYASSNSGHRGRTKTIKVSYYVFGHRYVTTGNEKVDRHLYDPTDSRVPNLWLGILPLFCPVDSPVVWRQYVVCTLGLLNYLFQMVEYSLGGVVDLPLGVYVLDESGFKGLLGDYLDEETIRIGFERGNLLEIISRRDIERCDVIQGTSRKGGAYVQGVTANEPKKSSRHGFWERVQRGGVGSTSATYVPIRAIAITVDF